MLRTALQPKWLGLLAGVLVVCGFFLWLGWWQLTSAFSSANAPADAEVYATPVPLGDLIAPGTGVVEAAAGRTVTANGWIDGRDAVVVEDRLQGTELGYWVVGRLVVADAEPLTPALDGPTVASQRPSIPIALGFTTDLDAAQSALAELSRHTPPASATANTEQLTAQLLPPGDAAVVTGEDPFAVVSMAPGHLINTWNEPSPGYYSAFLVLHPGSDVAVPAELVPIEIVPVDQSMQLNLLNIFYAIEWAIFIVMAFYIWWRLVRDDAEAQREMAAEAPRQLADEIRREKLREIAAQRAAAARKDHS